MTTTDAEHAGSNRLPTLAAEIRKAHADVQDAAKTAAQRAIDAGHALTEAKALLRHGEWLPWLRENCALAERTAQLYMQIAKSGNPAEVVAVVGLQGAALAASHFFDPEYDPFFHCSEHEKLEWNLFVLFLALECSWYPEGASFHVEYLCQKQFKSPDDWLTGAGPRWRKHCNMNEPTEGFLQNWRKFLVANRHRSLDDIQGALKARHAEIGPMPPDSPPPKRRRRKAQPLRISESAL
jgi:hypothetical protein